jgi:glycosyltransferase involved in cell wall biosynthesis
MNRLFAWMAPMRVLLLLGQLPQDPASGAARSMNTICQMLAAGGAEVHALATMATEQGLAGDPLDLLRRDGSLDAATAGESIRAGAALRFKKKGVAYTLLHVGNCQPWDWDIDFGQQFDELYLRELSDFKPDIIFTFGGTPFDRRRRRLARDKGSAVVFGLRNLQYLLPGSFDDVDAILTGSEFVTRRYQEVLGLASTPLPLPMDWDQVLAPQREAVFFTFINPTIEKGAMFFARFAEELSVHRPDIPLLVVESRGAAGRLVEAGRKGGFDLERHQNIMMSPGTTHPWEIYATTRVLLAPSVWEEPAGRVAVEAMINGIPPIVSDRGGLPEVCRGGGFVLPLPTDLTTQTTTPVSAAAVKPWIELAIRLADDEAFYADASAAATAAAQEYRPERVAARYQEFFKNVAGARQVETLASTAARATATQQTVIEHAKPIACSTADTPFPSPGNPGEG